MVFIYASLLSAAGDTSKIKFRDGPELDFENVPYLFSFQKNLDKIYSVC